MTKSKPIKKFAEKTARDQQIGARRTVMEELFNDLYNDRRNIYRMNLFRGIFFGLGSALGATLFVSLTVWVLSLFVDLPGILGDTAEKAQNQLESRQ